MMKRENKLFLRALRKDNITGSSELAKRCAEYIYKVCENKIEKEQLEEVLLEMVSAQPAMSQIFNLVNSVLFSMRKDNWNDNVKKVSKNFLVDPIRVRDKIEEIGKKIIRNGAVILTHSKSRNVFSLLSKAKESGRKFVVIVTESRPQLEGRLLAKELGKCGIPTIFIVDSAAPTFLMLSDLVMLGADRVSERFFVNKIGSLGIASLAFGFGKPVYVVCEKTKFVPEKAMSFVQEKKNPKEILKEKLRNVWVENFYFERIPNFLVKSFVTEKGFFPPEKLIREIKNIKVHPLLFTDVHR